jgi:TRAP-type mannitol/chloroaromatic compound transport system permease small subunit
MAAGLSPALEFCRRIDMVAIYSGRLVSWMIVPMVFSLAYEVVARYGFRAPTVWAFDMTFMLYGSFFMLGASYTLQRKGHIRTDSLYGGWSPRTQGIVDTICYLVFFFPFVLTFAVTGWEYFYKAYTSGERFVSSPWMAKVWPFKLVLPVAGALLALQGVSEMLKGFHAIKHNAWPQEDAGE